MFFKKKDKRELNELIEYIQFRCGQLSDHRWQERWGKTRCEICQKYMTDQDELNEMEKGFVENLQL